MTYALKKVLQSSDYDSTRKMIAHNICFTLMTICGASVVNTIYTMRAGFVDIIVTQLKQPREPNITHLTKNCYRFAALVISDICLEDPEAVEAFIPFQDELLETQSMLFIGPKLLQYGTLTDQMISFVERFS